MSNGTLAVADFVRDNMDACSQDAHLQPTWTVLAACFFLEGISLGEVAFKADLLHTTFDRRMGGWMPPSRPGLVQYEYRMLESILREEVMRNRPAHERRHAEQAAHVS
ncbi:MAG: hypothetical protein AB7G06_05875 [Bdellovibrionales bacterium]